MCNEFAERHRFKDGIVWVDQKLHSKPVEYVIRVLEANSQENLHSIVRRAELFFVFKIIDISAELLRLIITILENSGSHVVVLSDHGLTIGHTEMRWHVPPLTPYQKAKFFFALARPLLEKTRPLADHYIELASTCDKARSISFENWSEEEACQQLQVHDLFMRIMSGSPRDLIATVERVKDFEGLGELYKQLEQDYELDGDRTLHFDDSGFASSEICTDSLEE